MNFLIENLSVTSSDRLMILSDKRTPKEVKHYLLSLAQETGAEIILIELSTFGMGSEPPIEVVASMKEADFVLMPTSESLTHSDAAREAARAGAAIVSMPRISLEMLKQGGIRAKPSVMRKLARRLLVQLRDAHEILLTTRKGSRLLMNIRDQKWYMDIGVIERGQIGNLPGGELFISPNDANGIAVIDTSIFPIGCIAHPIEFIFKRGRCNFISSKRIRKLVDARGPEARNCAEFAIGLNPMSIIIGNILEDEKVFGTCHIGLGNDLSFGGETDVKFHLDGVIRDPIIFIKRDNAFERLVIE